MMKETVKCYNGGNVERRETMRPPSKRVMVRLAKYRNAAMVTEK